MIDYGVIDILEQSDRGLTNALDEADDMCEKGWRFNESTVLRPRLRLVDTGYRYDVIGPWLQGHKSWFGVKGYSKGQRELSGKKKLFEMPGILQVRLQDDGNKLWFIWVDETKSICHDRYFAELGQSGYTYVPEDISHGYKMHLSAEEREYRENSDEYTWKKKRKRNDWLDCRSYSVCGNLYLCVREDFEKEVEEKQAAKDEAAKRKQISPISGGGFLNSRGRFYG